MKTTHSPIPVRRLHWRIALLGAALLMCSGCMFLAVGAAGAAGAGAVAYVRGDLSTTLTGEYETVVTASNRALADLRFAKVSERSDALSSAIVARTAQDRKITITCVKSADKLVHVTIRVGVFGDESLSLAILDRIKGNA